MIKIKRILSFISALILTAVFVISPKAYAKDNDLEHLSDYNYSKFKGKNITLNIANWGEYMSVNDPDYMDVNKKFEKLTGIKINYQTYESNETLYSKIKGSGADYDIIIPSDYMISRMIKENMIQKLNFDNIPNFKYIDKKFVNPVYDPKNEYSVPYTWGVVAIVYNKKLVDDKVDSWDILWDEKYRNNILMFNNPRDAFGVALLREGYSLNTENKKEILAASEQLKKQKPIVQAYVMDEIFGKMESGSSAIGVYYAGDIKGMMDVNPDLTYALPKEGTNRFTDAICIPKTAKNKEAAEMYINFLCETDIALANCEYIGYSTPHTEAYKLLDDETKNNPLQYPDDEYLNKKTEAFLALSDETTKFTQEQWNELKIEQDTNSIIIFVTFMVILLIIDIITKIIRAKKKKEELY